jgi:hypothetical protein
MRADDHNRLVAEKSTTADLFWVLNHPCTQAGIFFDNFRHSPAYSVLYCGAQRCEQYMRNVLTVAYAFCLPAHSGWRSFYAYRVGNIRRQAHPYTGAYKQRILRDLGKDNLASSQKDTNRTGCEERLANGLRQGGDPCCPT